MTDRDQQTTDDRAGEEANPPTKNALRAGFAYLIVLALVLTALAAWFVLTRTAHPAG